MSHEARDFEAEVLERSKEVPVLAAFWAPWCGPCRTLGPVLERMATQAGSRWELVKINTEEHQDLAAAFNIASITAVNPFVDGKVANEFVGALPEREIRRFFEKALPSPSAC
jgi:putative thioredoxin